MIYFTACKKHYNVHQHNLGGRKASQPITNTGVSKYSFEVVICQNISQFKYDLLL